MGTCFSRSGTAGREEAYLLKTLLKKSLDERLTLLDKKEKVPSIIKKTITELNKTITAPTAWHLVSIQCSRTVHYTLN